MTTMLMAGLLGCGAASEVAPAPAAPAEVAPAPAREEERSARRSKRGKARPGEGRPEVDRPVASDGGPVIAALQRAPAPGAGCACSLPGQADLVYWSAAASKKATMNLDGQDRSLTEVGERFEGEQRVASYAGAGYVFDLKFTPEAVGEEGATFVGHLTFINDGVVVERTLDCSCGS